MKIAIVEDSYNDAEFLKKGIQNYCETNHLHSDLLYFSGSHQFLATFQAGLYDVIFLDIYLDDIDGMDLAERIRRKDEKCLLVFCTTSDFHAVKAFKVHALDYLVKPYSQQELNKTLDMCKAQIGKNSYYIRVKEGRGYMKVLISSILYTDYHNHYIQIHTKERVIRSYMVFSEFMPLLAPYKQFLYCYRNCLINMDYVEALDGKDFVLTNKERIPIARGWRQEIIQTYADYTFDYVNGVTTL